MKNLFDGVTVIDFSGNAAGPIVSAMMADFGAEVIKIERPGGGDDTRGFPPFLDQKMGVVFLYLNRGKKSMTVDMTTPEGLNVIKQLISKADVVLENFRPGTMKKFGLDYPVLQSLNPGIIMCSISGYGQTGPDWWKPGYDLIAQAASGIADLTGFPDGPPVRSGVVIGDYVTGHNAFAAVCAALYQREKTGQGQHIDLALVDCLVSLNSHVELLSLGKKPGRQGNHHSMLCPFGVFQAKSGSVVVCAPNPKLWANLCQVMGKPELVDDPRFASGGKRLENIEQVTKVICDWVDSFDCIDDAIVAMEAKGIPCSKVYTTADLLDSEQLKFREMIIDLETPTGMTTKTIKARGNQLKFSSAKAVLKRAPNLGEHNQEVLQSLGYSQEQAGQLIEQWCTKK